MDGKVVGIDLGTCLQVGRALGADEQALVLLLPAAEAGMMEGLAELQSDGGG